MVDTKFTSIFVSGRYGGFSLKSGYIYQMYAYLRSQEGRGIEWDNTSGLFLHPAISESIYEHADIQGHCITFATVNLAGTTAAIRSELRSILSRQSCIAVPERCRANVGNLKPESKPDET